jgi:AbrB family looped-hinge helix DNA binding protein
MERRRLSKNGQISLPKALRDLRGWGPGTEFTLEETGEGLLLRPATRIEETALKDVAGCLRFTGRRKTIAQMNAAAAKEVKRRRDAGRY